MTVGHISFCWTCIALHSVFIENGTILFQKYSIYKIRMTIAFEEINRKNIILLSYSPLCAKNQNKLDNCHVQMSKWQIRAV